VCAEAVDSQKNSRSTPFDLLTSPVVKIADLGNACWTVSNCFCLPLIDHLMTFNVLVNSD